MPGWGGLAGKTTPAGPAARIRNLNHRPEAMSRRLSGRRQGGVTVLFEPPPATPQSVAGCLGRLQQQWQQQHHLAALWQRWPRLAGPQLAPHCRPLRLSGRVLSVGAAPGPWLQALSYNRHQLLAALRSAGFDLRDIRVEQHHPGATVRLESDAQRQSWQEHPSRLDGQTMTPCPRCGCPAPPGEVRHWGHCSFCRCSQLRGD